MNRRFICLALAALFLLALPVPSPAPFIWRPGEGWTYEPVGSQGAWQRPRAKEQLEVAQQAFEKKDYGLALKAARRIVRAWPLSDYAPQARYLVGRCYEAQGKDVKAFKEYESLLENQPRFEHFEEILNRQSTITDAYLAGKWFRVWDLVPVYPSMDRTAGMYEQIVRNGPFSEVAPQAQLKIGTAREKEKNYPLAAKAFEEASYRYHDNEPVAAEATFRQGLAYQKQAQTAEYDQSTAGRAIATFTDFIALYPNDARVPEARKIIASLRTEQARGSYQTALFYEKYKRWKGALVYYNETLLKDPNSIYAAQAREKIDALKKRIQGPAPTK
jgi:outer membrane protein assembly factor BamD